MATGLAHNVEVNELENIRGFRDYLGVGHFYSCFHPRFDGLPIKTKKEGTHHSWQGGKRLPPIQIQRR